MTLRIGLTGPIGCGKSTIGRWLRELGGAVIDADAVAREVTTADHQDWPTLPAIRARFGDDVFAPDGSLDRAALAKIVFTDAVALRDLESIVHPAVRWRLLGLLREAEESGVPFVVIEAIKLVEGGLAEQCDEVWLVECSPETQRRRLEARGAEPADIDRRVAVQGPDLIDRLKERLMTGHEGVFVWELSTEGDSVEVRERVQAGLAEAMAAARGRPARPPAIQIVDYDARWPELFEEERMRIAEALGDAALGIEHMGSTSVPGLSAKPIIDIMLVVPSTPMPPAQVEAMRRLGYAYHGEFGIGGRDYFNRHDPRTYHVHAYPRGHPEVERHLVFRDYLRADPQEAARYAEMKRRVALTARDRDSYTVAKTPLIREIERRAREWRIESEAPSRR